MLALVFSCRKEIKACLGSNRPPAFDVSTPWKIGQRQCLLLVCGTGPLVAFKSLRLFLTQQQVCGILNMGLAGAYNKNNWTLGQTALVSHEIWPQDEPVSTDDCFARHLTQWGQELELEPVKAARRMGLCLPTGKTAKATTVHQPSTPQRGQNLRKIADVENMEGFALALACRSAAIPFLEIRTISNFCGETDRNKTGFSRACPALHKALSELGF